MPSPVLPTTGWARLGLAALSSAPLVLGAALWGSAGRDDSYITYWPAQRLAETGEIVNYNGDRLEQSSSLLHTLLLALLSAITPWSVPAWGIALGVMGASSAVVAAFAVGRLVSGRAAWLAAGLVAVQGYFIYWAWGGLETSLAAALLLWTLVAGARWFSDASSARWPFIVSQALFVAVRPEAGLVLVVALLTVAAMTWFGGASRASVRPAVEAVGVVVATYMGLGLARFAYFGDFVPQPVRSKVGGLEIARGLDYAETWLGRPALLPLIAAALAGVVVGIMRPTPIGLLLATTFAAAVGSVVTSGGDWMEAGRLLVPALAVACVLAAVVLDRLPASPAIVLGALLIVSQLFGALQVARDDSTGLFAGAVLTGLTEPLPDGTPWFERDNRVHARDAIFIPRLVTVVRQVSATRSPVTIASGQAGMVPYYVMAELGGDALFIDRGNLSTAVFSACEDGLVQTVLGNAMPLDYWVENEARCEVPLADVVYDVGRFPQVLASRYTLVYEQPAVPLSSDNERLPGVNVSQGMFLAVRTDRLGDIEPRR